MLCSSGQLLEQVSVGLVCPHGVRPRVCRSECLRASCQAHSDAVCVADPCNECRVTFYRWVVNNTLQHYRVQTVPLVLCVGVICLK